MSDILEQLNEEQRKPAEITNGAILVIAGAGSGKTRLLTHRVAFLVKEKNIKPSNILAITFTNKATREMLARIENMIGETGMWISTFHSMCCKILRRDINRLNGFSSNFTIYGEPEKERVIKRLLAMHTTKLTADSCGWHISNAKNKLLSPEGYAKEIGYDKNADLIINIYAGYQNELKLNNALDFDDLLCKTHELLKNEPDILEYYQDKFKYIHVDEFQDTNRAQYQLIKLLSGKHKNVFVVGDEDQCIYTWRGAEVNNISEFKKDFKGTQVFKLEQNYRSTKNILSHANSLISNNTNRTPKELWTHNEEGNKIETTVFYNDLEEAEWVAGTVKNMVVNQGYKYNDFAVLMRVNSLSRAIEEKFTNYNIPHQVYGGFKFFERKEVKDTISYLRIIDNPKDSDALVRALGFPKRGIGDISILNLRQMSEDNDISMYDTFITGMNLPDGLNKKFQPVREQFLHLKQSMETMPLYDFVDYTVRYLGLKEAIGNKTEEDLTKQMNIDMFVMSVKEFADANEGASVSDYLQSITLMRDIDELNEENDFVSIMTIHSAKGLEFKCVFLIGLNDGLFPLTRAILSSNEDDMEEERRLMYVAMTRARDRLFITRGKTRFVFETKRTEYTIESRFIKEAKLSKKPEQTEGLYSRERSDMFGFRSKHYDDDKTLRSYEEVDKPERASPKINSDYYKFKKGSKVKHPHFGNGEVIVEVTDSVGAFITIRFEGAGIKTLSLKFAPIELIE